MSKKNDAKEILRLLRVPEKQLSDICCYSLLAMAGITESDEWSHAQNEWIRIHDIMAFIKENYDVIYAENSRETFRKQAMHEFRNAAFIEDNRRLPLI